MNKQLCFTSEKLHGAQLIPYDAMTFNRKRPVSIVSMATVVKITVAVLKRCCAIDNIRLTSDHITFYF